jgi:hypothetical protein
MVWVPLVASLLACGAGGGGLGGGGGGGALKPWAISDAANPTTAADVHNLLEVGDHYQFEPNNAAANAILENLWARLTAVRTWVGTNPGYTYQFYNDGDPNTHWGPAYRFTGESVWAGPVRPYTAGTYTRANGSSYQAATLRTWDETYAEILVLIDANAFVHANQKVNGLPLIETYSAR